MRGTKAARWAAFELADSTILTGPLQSVPPGERRSVNEDATIQAAGELRAAGAILHQRLRWPTGLHVKRSARSDTGPE